MILLKILRIACLFVCLCILHQSCLTITAGTGNCPTLGGLGSCLHLLFMTSTLYSVTLCDVRAKMRRHYVFSSIFHHKMALSVLINDCFSNRGRL